MNHNNSNISAFHQSTSRDLKKSTSNGGKVQRDSENSGTSGGLLPGEIEQINTPVRSPSHSASASAEGVL